MFGVWYVWMWLWGQEVSGGVAVDGKERRRDDDDDDGGGGGVRGGVQAEGGEGRQRREEERDRERRENEEADGEMEEFHDATGWWNGFQGQGFSEEEETERRWHTVVVVGM